MEPVDEPRRIRVDDRSNVKVRIVNLSPLDVCSLGGRTPTPTAETPRSRIAGRNHRQTGRNRRGISAVAGHDEQRLNENAATHRRDQAGAIPPACHVRVDSEYLSILRAQIEFSSRRLSSSAR